MSDAGSTPHVALAAGCTATAEIEGLSAAGADSSLLAHTPSADAEVLCYGDVVAAPELPVAPTGCPTPALVSRAAREVLGFDATVFDAGLAAAVGAPTVDVGAAPGADVRDPVAVPDAAEIVAAARGWARSLPVDRLALAETIPGGTTTALALLRALGERPAVSSSLQENPIERKRGVVADGLGASDLDPGDCAGRPVAAIRAVGDPVQATLLGALAGASEAGTHVELWGGTQQLAVAAAARHAASGGAAGLGASASDADLPIATTSYVAEDDSAAVRALADDLDVDLAVVDPCFDSCDHDGLRRFAAGEAKEGVGMGGALALAERRGALPAVRTRAGAIYDDVLSEAGAGRARGSTAAGDPESGRGDVRGP